jgi:hypothetical protein
MRPPISAPIPVVTWLSPDPKVVVFMPPAVCQPSRRLGSVDVTCWRRDATDT